MPVDKGTLPTDWDRKRYRWLGQVARPAKGNPDVGVIVRVSCHDRRPASVARSTPIIAADHHTTGTIELMPSESNRATTHDPVIGYIHRKCGNAHDRNGSRQGKANSFSPRHPNRNDRQGPCNGGIRAPISQGKQLLE
jgi:hypothetical protein